MNDYQEFVKELQTNFGPYDPMGDTEVQLMTLEMKDGHRINKYVVEFNRHASQLHGYGESALRRLFYDGLPERIKDDITRVGKPSTLAELRNLSQTFDARYWERKSEVTQHAKPSNIFDKTHVPFRPTSAPSLPSNPTSGSKAPKDNKKSEAKPVRIDLSLKLGDNGKLTTQERKR